jgi:hypothetical protein
MTQEPITMLAARGRHGKKIPGREGRQITQIYVLEDISRDFKENFGS